MGKLLRVLVIIILVLSAVSLLFAYKLFGKQELLTKRSSILEEQVVKLAKTIEAADAADAAAPDVKKDVSEVADRVVDNPDKEAVLEGYPIKLEQQNLPTLDYGSTDKRLQLRSYFVIGADGKPVPDPLDQKPMTKGPGSMQELLDQAFDRAKAQQASLNKTRAELTKMREKATTFVEEINKLKADGRTTKVELKTTKEQVVTLTGEKEALEGRVTKLTAEKKEISAELADAKNEVEKLNELKVTITEELAKAQETIKEMKKKWTTGEGRPGQETGSTAVSSLSAGDKGKIIEANDALKFVIIDFSNDAIAEMLGPERQNAMPQLEMNVRRTGRQSAAGEFVTRIKLRQIVRGKNLVVADILSDVVFF
jgi:DNA repair exonuclease SbcCD ATPase subunit